MCHPRERGDPESRARSLARGCVFAILDARVRGHDNEQRWSSIRMVEVKSAPAGMGRLAADGLLLITACLWGVTSVAHAVGVLPPLAFVAARFAVSALALAPLALLEQRQARARPRPGPCGLRSGSRSSWERVCSRPGSRRRALPTAAFSPLLCRADPVRRLGALGRQTLRARARRRIMAAEALALSSSARQSADRFKSPWSRSLGRQKGRLGAGTQAKRD